MANRKTSDFLPKIFQTETNEKFLNATLDQLVSDVDFVKLDGYVGRKFAPTYKPKDSYILETDKNRKNYQLEPSVIVSESGDIKFYSDYVDLINRLEYYGANIDNHDRLFSSEYYSFGGLIDLDKFVNFSQYYWLPNGPDAILIGESIVNSHQTFTVSRNLSNGAYTFDELETKNPEITLMRGGVYKFKVSQLGNGFWIQTEPGESGTKKRLQSVSSRDVLGVTNNGSDNGEIEFFVPLADSQDFYLKMPINAVVDFALSDVTFKELDGANLGIVNTGIFDGITIDPDGKTFIFTSESESEEDWYSDRLEKLIESKFRRGIWRASVDRTDINDPRIILQYIANIDIGTRVYVSSGLEYVHNEFFKNEIGYLKLVPTLTAQLDELYYQDSTDPNICGRIRLVDRTIEAIDVEQDILGKKYWQNKDGVTLANGMKVQFGQHIMPSKYANKTYIVEGVGSVDGISMIDYSLLVNPESGGNETLIGWDIMNFDRHNIDESYSGPTQHEYIVSNRSSLDLNPWSRTNCWFHISIIEAAALHNGTIVSVDSLSRAKRPIIEFLPNIQMFNSGLKGMRPVDQIDNKFKDALNQIQHSDTLNFPDLNLVAGQRILFINDNDPLVKTQVYTVEYGIQDESVETTYYDSIGAGILQNNHVYIDFSSDSEPIALGQYDTTNPNLNLNYEYTWSVRSHSSILNAKVIEGLELASGSPDANITGIKHIGNNNYQITFKANVPIIRFINQKIKIRISNGSKEIIGHGTQFQNQITPGSEIYDINDVYIGKVAVIQSDTLMFLENQTDRRLVNDIFKIKKPRIRLIASNDTMDLASIGSCVVAKKGINRGKTFWFNGDFWTEAQAKTKRNQAPLFDVFDSNDKSLSSKDIYPGSNFIGTKIFSYKIGIGQNDPILGFPIYYTTSNSIASEITFENNFDNDNFEYLLNNRTVNELVSIGSLRKNISPINYSKASIWNLVSNKTKQYQIINTRYTGKSNNFIVDIEPESYGNLSNIKVFLNNALLSTSDFKIKKVNSITTVEIVKNLLTENDKIDILIYSKSVSDIGYYQIPPNLEYNSENKSLLDLNFGQLRNHLTAICQNNNLTTNSVDVRNLDLSMVGGNILQHTAPILYSSLFLISKSANFIDALDYARREYVSFKHKFLELANTLLNENQSTINVDVILAIINQNKNKDFPWYYSDMVPYGKHKIYSYKIFNIDQKKYKIDSNFSLSKLQSKAILVYFNGNLLLHGKDYVFDKILPTINLSDDFNLSLNGLLEIKEYETDGNFIPETPTKLGLYPKFLPEILLDDTYQKPIKVIQGHDGSITPVFGDYRDELLLDLEIRIYNNIKKIDLSAAVNINEFIPGQFRSTDYSLKEYNNILSGSFLKWVGDNKLDYSSNNYVINGDLFSYNYKSSKNKITNEFSIGYWRGIYKFLYDTDRPHTHPWEMLGFSEKPDWWKQTYGPEPYTSNNLNLWSDLENGIIRHGNRKGIDSSYVRTGLSKVIPVDDQGNLQPPTSVIISKFNANRISDSYSFGDQGPVEMAWRKSSEYPFALQRAVALMKPAVYFGTLFDVNGYFKYQNTGEYINKKNNQRVTPKTIILNGENSGTTISRSSGYLNFIIAHLNSLGVDPFDTLRGLLNNISVQLSYKMSGFSDKKYLTVLAEQYSPTSINESVIIPSENYEVYLNKGTPFKKITYSAVIIEKTQNGYSVSGYNTSSPNFIIVPSDPAAGSSYRIDVDTATATVFNKYKKEKILIPYGQEFTNKQQVVDFLISYQRYLMSLGFVFDEFDENLKEQRNWVLSAKEFLSWTLQYWTVKSILVLSPVNSKLNLLLDGGTVDDLGNKSNTLMDLNFNNIKIDSLLVNRKSGKFSIESTIGDTIGLADLNIIQYEHALIFDNTTIFNDVIYKPELGSRQFRLKLIGSKTGNWSGTISSPGFIFNNTMPDSWKTGRDYLRGDLVEFKKKYYVAIQKIPSADSFNFGYWKQIPKSSIKTGMLPNLSQNASKFIDFYNVDSEISDKQLQKFGSGLIGYRHRDYLTDLNINVTSQTKFYQGYIKDKGTKKSIMSLLSASVNNSKSQDINFDEEWAIRVGDYGAQNNNNILDLTIENSDRLSNASGLIIDADINSSLDFVSVKSDRKYLTDSSSFPGFSMRNKETSHDMDIPTAGYVNLDDINFTLFNITDESLNSISLESLVVGMHILLAKDSAFNWQVFRVDNSNNHIKYIEYALDMTAIVTTNFENKLKVGDLVIIKNLHPLLDKVYLILDVLGSNKFSIVLDQKQVTFLKQGALKSVGNLLLLTSTRYLNLPSVIEASKQPNWSNSTKFWVDSDENNKWAFYEKASEWDLERKISLEISNTAEFVGYGSSIAISPNQQFMASGSPGKNDGCGRIHILNFSDETQKIDIIDSKNPNIQSFGFNVIMSNEYLISGSPKFKNGVGSVIVCALNKSKNKFEILQLIQPPDNQNKNSFGYSVSLTNDSKILYIGSPGNKAVYKYLLTRQDRDDLTQFIEFNSLLNLYPLNPTFLDFDNISYMSVDINDDWLLQGIDYSIDRDSLVFSDQIFLKYQFKSSTLISGQAYTIRVKLRAHYKYSGIKLTGGTSSSLFGQSISVGKESNLLVVGAPLDSDSSSTVIGSVYVFKSDQLLQKLSLEDLNFRSNFGISVDCSNDGSKIYVGCPNYNRLENFGGAVFCYEKINQEYKIGQILSGLKDQIRRDFGYKIKLSPNNKSLLVSSLRGSTKIYESVDQNTTIFDSNTTKFCQQQEGTGSVHLYEMLSSESIRFINTKEFLTDSLKPGDRFGNAIDLSENYIFIGSDLNTSQTGQFGEIYKYVNYTGTSTWVKSRSQNDLVDINLINKVCLFDKNTGNILADLDYIDPVKGKILGIVDQDLDYRTTVDPAVYNSGSSNLNISNIDHNWGFNQIGKTWWDLSKVRYIDYEQSELSYRLKTWGQLFPGSKIHVYEWTESSVPPSRHVSSGNPGVPYNDDDSEYATISYTNAQSQVVTVKYYYWVRLLSKVPPNSNRLISISDMESAILNPRLQNIPYIAFLSKNSVAIFNCWSYLKESDTTLRIYYNKTLNSNLSHSEHILVRDGNNQTRIPDLIIDKMIDSLSGIDSIGQVVPDPTLTEKFKLGLMVRPRQTITSNNLAALQNIIIFINSILNKDSVVLQIQNSLEFKNSRLNLIDQLPEQFNHKIDNREELNYLDPKNGDTVLIMNDAYYANIWTLSRFNNGALKLIKNQTFDTKRFWRMREWYATGFSSDIIIDFVVDHYSAIDRLAISSGNIIKVLSSSGFEIYYFDTPTNSRLIGLEYGIIEFFDSIWDSSKIGFDNQPTDQSGFDGNKSIEIRQILNALRHEILIGELSGLFNQMIFVLIDYVLSEQNQIDWAFKTSFISVVHNIRSLEQSPNFVKDNQNYYIDYINEVKPYRTKIKDYVLSYSNLDLGKVHTTDFDLPSAWDNDLKMYRSPTGEYPVKDGELLLQPKYQDWLDNLYYVVESIKIIRPGSGFSSNPSIKIVSVDGFGSGATAVASVNQSTGSIFSVVVTNSGSGYVRPPMIIVNGDGANCELVAVISNKKVRSFSITLKFDRVSFETQVTEWLPNKSYKFGSIVSYQEKGYRANKNVPPLPLFNYSLFSLMSDSEYISANDRIASIYRPNYYQPEKEINSDGSINLSRLIPGVIPINELDDGKLLDFGDDLSQPLDFTLKNQTQYVKSGGTANNSNLVAAPEELVPGIAFESLSIKVFTKWDVRPILYYDAANASSYSGGNTINDISGNNNQANISLGYAPEISQSFGGIGIIEFPSNENTKIDFTVKQLSSNTKIKTITIEMWAIIDSFSNGMFFGWLTYDVWTREGMLGFNTSAADLYGISSQKVLDLNLANRWAHYVFVMNSGDYRLNKIYIDGVKQDLSQRASNQNLERASFNNGLGRIGGWRNDNNYQQAMKLGIFGIYGLELSQVEISRLFNDKKSLFGFAQSLETSTDSSNILAYRIIKDHSDSTNYFAMSRNQETTLTQDLHWDDTLIYVENASVLTKPDVAKRIPGIVYIAGEKIRYFIIDVANNTIGQLLRGLDNTSIPEMHSAGSKVEDASIALKIPSSILTKSESITFNKAIRSITTSFDVSTNLDQVKNNLLLKIGQNILPLNEYYTLIFDKSLSSRVMISFTKAARDRILDGIIIDVTYDQECIWLNPGPNTATDGQGFVSSTTPQVKFLKNNPF
jgi:hypothetical protein